jgi:choline dehydrogenase-like flavoprotein
VIVAGGGSAGCVAAARLSADDRCRVLLLEAGPDYPAAGDLPADIADGSMPATSHDWGFIAEPDERGRSVPLPRGRLIGGCSATNACFALRGWPQDYDQWAARGNPGWSFADLLPASAPSSPTPISAATGTGPAARSRSAGPRPASCRPGSAPSPRPLSPPVTGWSATTTSRARWVRPRPPGTSAMACG